MAAFESSHKGQFTSSTQLTKPNFAFDCTHTKNSNTVSVESNPFAMRKTCMCLPIVKGIHHFVG